MSVFEVVHPSPKQSIPFLQSAKGVEADFTLTADATWSFSL
uniref:Uncharacterized protein n=1 Tax=Arundo donax TaxID=35708 RepID=A0A0A9GER1_ARUDO